MSLKTPLTSGDVKEFALGQGADIPGIAQAKPGDTIKFIKTSPDEAILALKALERRTRHPLINQS